MGKIGEKPAWQTAAPERRGGTEQEKAFDTDGTDFHEPAEPDRG
jgi:hypothetical protein